MPAKKKHIKSAVKTSKSSVAEFLADPMISTALIVFGLLALLFSILEFTKATTI